MLKFSGRGNIAKDDFELAKKMSAKKIEYVHGVGVDIDKFHRRDELDRNNSLRKSIGIQDNQIVLLSVGELNRNKNHVIVLKALQYLKPNIVYVICGDGELRQEYERYIEENHLENRVFIMGFRPDINEFYKMADLLVFPSLREGIPGAIMEAIATGVPVVASDIRGIRDLITDDRYRFSPFDCLALAQLINSTTGNNNISNIETNIKALEPYLFCNVVNEMRSIYKEMLKSIED